MSEKNVGIISEGYTDYLLLNSIICKKLNKDIDCKRLQPKAFSKDSGWFGVLNFCKTRIASAGFRNYLNLKSAPLDLLVIAIDGDQFNEGTIYCAKEATPFCPTVSSVNQCYQQRTAKEFYHKCSIYPTPSIFQRLPISTRVNNIESCVLAWCGLSGSQDELIIVIPCDMIECWIVAALDGPVVNHQPVEEIENIYRDYVGRHSLYHGWDTSCGKTDFFECFMDKTVQKWANVCSACSQAKKLNDLLSSQL